MESEENSQVPEYSSQQGEFGDESSGQVKEDVFLNAASAQKDNETSLTEKNEYIYEDDPESELYEYLADPSKFLDSSGASTSSYMGPLDANSGFENIFEGLSNKIPQFDETGNEIFLPSPIDPNILEGPPVAPLHETETGHSGSDPSPEISADVDDPNTSENFPLPSDHSYARTNPYECSICKLKYRMENAFLAHLQTHSVYKIHQCKHCERQFHNAVSFFSHLNTHTKERPFICTRCNFRFESARNLKVHEKKHSGAKPYICQYCQRGFAQSNDLLRHIRTHTGVKPYVCSLCSKAFSRKHHLDGHLISHSEPKEFICEICNQKFLRRYNFNRHREQHEGAQSL